MGTDLKEIKEIKEAITKTSNKGFTYFAKNAGIVLLVLFAIFVVSNPSLIINPSQFISNFDVKSIWIIAMLLLSIGGIYQLAKSISRDNSKVEKAETIKNYTDIANEVAVIKENRHKALVERRIAATPLIQNELKTLLINLGADRATIAEMHNGTNNLNGLPFVFFDVTYEAISKDVKYVSEDFKNINMGKYPFICNHFIKGTFIGSVSEIEEEDIRLATLFKLAEANYGVAIVLHGLDGPLGFLTVTFKNTDDLPSKTEMMQEVDAAAQRLSTLLDKTIC